MPKTWAHCKGVEKGTLGRCKNCGLDLIVTHDDKGNQQTTAFMGVACKKGKNHEISQGIGVMVIR